MPAINDAKASGAVQPSPGHDEAEGYISISNPTSRLGEEWVIAPEER